MLRNLYGKIGLKQFLLLSSLKILALTIFLFQPTIQFDSIISYILILKTICIHYSVDPLEQVNRSMFQNNLLPTIMILIILSFALDFLDKLMLIRFKDLSIARYALEEERVSIGLKKVEIKLLSLLMISICHKKRRMELNLQLNYLDNGWTMVDGTILKPNNLKIYVELTL